jgi:hypothetical protein
MPKFTVESPSKHSAEETYQRIKKLLDGDTDLKKMDGKLTCTFDDMSLTGRASGSQFKADIKIISSASVKVQVDVEIPLLLSPFKGKIHDVLTKKLSKTLA